ncbi:MAG TPA: hypothetical protein QF753_08840 [Victivallales bacterium]|nr:hypothetical protein [Victivallales bacterium]
MKCPGQNSIYWKFDSIYEVNCPECNKAIEFFKDDIKRRCPECGFLVLNPKINFGCASHCKFAEQCLGDSIKEFLPENADGSSEDSESKRKLQNISDLIEHRKDKKK